MVNLQFASYILVFNMYMISELKPYLNLSSCFMFRFLGELLFTFLLISYFTYRSTLTICITNQLLLLQVVTSMLNNI